jgi:hypothetical protein
MSYTTEQRICSQIFFVGCIKRPRKAEIAFQKSDEGRRLTGKAVLD